MAPDLLGDGISISVGGCSVLGEGVLALRYPEMQEGASQPRGDLLREDVPQARGNRMVS